MAERVNITTAAKLTGRAEKTIRVWLAEDPPPLSIEYGQYRGGRRVGKTVTKGRTRLLDVDELRALHVARGGVDWHAQYLPVPDVRGLVARVAELEAQLATLREHSPWLFTSISRVARSEGQQTAWSDTDAPLTIPAPRRPASVAAARPMSRGASGLPAGLVSVAAFAHAHGMAESQRTTWRKAIQTGRLPVQHNAATWRHNGTHVEYALDAEGRRVFCELWQHAEWFRPCEDCPHE